MNKHLEDFKQILAASKVDESTKDLMLSSFMLGFNAGKLEGVNHEIDSLKEIADRFEKRIDENK